MSGYQGSMPPTGSTMDFTTAAPMPSVAGAVKPPPRDDVVIMAMGQAIGGWESISITRSAENVPADFAVSLTDYNPATTLFDVIREGTPIQVLIGGDLVLTGYVDAYMASIDAHRHTVKIAGRSASEDLVDSSARVLVNAQHPAGNQISGGTFLQIAQYLAAPYGVTVKSQSANGDHLFPAFNFIFTETPFEIIERVARFCRCLVYDNPDGSLLISDLGQTAMASGVAEGVNVQQASVVFSMAERFQVYIPSLMGTDAFPMLAAAAGLQGNQGMEIVTDPGVPTIGIGGVPRLRQLIVVSMDSQADLQGNVAYIAEQRAQWEAARRRGRSQTLRCVVDSWRDSAGTLWAPNATVPVNLPSLHLTPQSPWIIGTVTYQRDASSGTTAELTVMSQEAFSVEPIPLQTIDPMLTPAARATGGAAAAHNPPAVPVAPTSVPRPLPTVDPTS